MVSARNIRERSVSAVPKLIKEYLNRPEETAEVLKGMGMAARGCLPATSVTWMKPAKSRFGTERSK